MAFYHNQDFLTDCIGTGLESSKPMFSNLSTVVASGEDKIHASIRMILSTRVGERLFVPEFGSRLHMVMFEQNSMVARDLAAFYSKDALSKWEKRIVVDEVSVGKENDDNIIPISIFYHIANSNIKGCYVYPFNVRDDGTPGIYSIGSVD